MNQIQSANGSNGRDQQGRFATGNSGGPGNPHAQQVATLRSALLTAVTPDDLEQVMRVLVTKALAGNVAAIKELLDRICGKPKIAIEVEQQPQKSPDELRASLRALLQKNPRLLEGLGVTQESNQSN